MTRPSLLLSFVFLAGACGGSDAEPKGPSTTQAAAPDEKSEENIQMSAGAPAPGKKADKPAPAASKPAAPAKPAALPK